MPPWGRPPGERQGRKRKEWERQRRQWEEQVRFEELDTDSDEGQGVGWGHHFKSDELHFSGADLGQLIPGRTRHNYSDNSDDYEDGDNYDDGGRSGSRMQVALREKEDVLVERALARIRRAQELGRDNVQLTEPERDALERKMQNDRAKGKKPVLRSKGSGESTRANTRKRLSAPTSKPKGSKSSLKKSDEPTGPLGPPGLVVAGPDGQSVFAPIGYYPSSSSRPSSRSNSAQNLRQPQIPASQAPYRSLPQRWSPSSPEYTSTRASMPARPLLPDDPNWRTRSRSSSATNPSDPVDPFQYLQSQPKLPARYGAPGGGRRNVSGPADFGYANLRPYQPNLPPRGYTSSSDPSLARREHPSSSGGGRYVRGGYASDEEGEEDDDDDDAMLVDVVPYGQGYEVNVSSSRAQQDSAAAAASGPGVGAGGSRPRRGYR